jgi:hypothetical protein
MPYRITSTRIGELGAIYEPVEGINVEALIAGGFIEATHTAPGKSAKNKTKAPDAANTTEE